MNDIRAKFEEIWPVPEGVYWSMNVGCYVCNDAVRMTQERINKCIEWDARLDTFTRCQETMAPVMQLVDEMLHEIEVLVDEAYNYIPPDTESLINRAKQILGRDQ